MIHDVSTPSSLNMTTQEWFHTVVTEDSGGKSADILTTFGFGWIDVRDYAEIQALALEKEDAGGERIIISAGEFSSAREVITVNHCLTIVLGPFVWQDWSE